MNFANQATGLASLGRGEDSMLVHMTPGEVGSLQQIAKNNGGSLTINPETGLPEAGFLGDILPAIAGVGLTMMGVPPIWAGLGIGALTGLVTGDLGKGVSAGLGGFGGASLGSGLSSMQSAVTPVAEVTKIGAATPSAASLYNPASLAASSAAAPSVMSQIGAGDFSRFAPNFGGGFGSEAASKLIGTGGKGAIKSGLLALSPALMSGMQDQTGGMPAPGDTDDMSKRYPYKGPYKFDEGAPSFMSDEQLRDADSSEWNYFPNIRYPQKYYAEGGDTGKYLRGPGDGMSDDIPATIDHGNGEEQPARLAAGEFVIPADVVSHLGNGDSESGAKKLYAMMDRVRHARTGNSKQGKEIIADKFLLA